MLTGCVYQLHLDAFTLLTSTLLRKPLLHMKFLKNIFFLCLLILFIEILRLEITSKIIKSNSHPSTTTTKPHPPLNHALKYHIHIFLEHFLGGWLHCFPEQPVPMLSILFCDFFFPLEPKQNLPQCYVRQTTPILSLVICEKRLTPTPPQPPITGTCIKWKAPPWASILQTK